MTKISQAFKNDKAFIGYITGGDPNIKTTAKLIRCMAASGVDVIEIGIPFSDPIAEGPVIQAASKRALDNGCTTDKLFDMVCEVRRDIDIPIIFMTYANPVFAYGKERFLKRCNQCGVDGLIIPDTPYEERSEFSTICYAHHVDLIDLVAPTSIERTAAIAKGSTGFLYCVSSLGVTGTRSTLSDDIKAVIDVAKSATSTPCAVGFGIATPEQAQHIVQYADGIIVGSAIVKLVARYGEDSPRYVSEYTKTIKAAITDK
ncbi:MAG TPA: tryptophan synthase subunit alpha [Clostridiales bacterium]|nr:tryptophan synthase subunit alpha [Clostridiales bacterium]